MGLFHHSKPGDYRIKYVLKGSAKDFNITYKCGSGSEVIQEPHVHRGWKYAFVAHPGDYFFLAAQANKPHSSVDLRVYQNGRLFKELKKEGDFPMVEASGVVN